MRLGRKHFLAVCFSVLCTVAALSGSALAGQPPPCNLPDVNGTLTTPSITCTGSTGSSITLQICGTGTYGAPGGFSIQMKTKAAFDADYAANPGAPLENRGWNQDATYRCWSLGGNANGAFYNLAAGGCVTLVIDQDFFTNYVTNGPPGASEGCGQAILSCGTEYIFRVFAHQYQVGGQACPKYNLDKSVQGPFNTTTQQTGQVCATAGCGGGECTLTWGYWKTHGPEGCSPGNQSNDWDVTELAIGGETLDQAAVCAILQDNPKACGKGGGANAVVILEHQLIAAMLNVANGAISCNSANAAIVAANALLSGHVNDCVGTSSVLGQQMLEQQAILAAYNSDICECQVPNLSRGSATMKPMASPIGGKAVKSAKPMSWGELKVIYR